MPASWNWLRILEYKSEKGSTRPTEQQASQEKSTSVLPKAKVRSFCLLTRVLRAHFGKLGTTGRARMGLISGERIVPLFYNRKQAYMVHKACSLGAKNTCVLPPDSAIYPGTADTRATSIGTDRRGQSGSRWQTKKKKIGRHLAAGMRMLSCSWRGAHSVFDTIEFLPRLHGLRIDFNFLQSCGLLYALFARFSASGPFKTIKAGLGTK